MGTGVNEVNNSVDISVFPNHARNNLTVKCTKKSEIEIVNPEGQILEKSASTGMFTAVDLSALSSGVYIIKVKTAEGITVRKFIKQ